MEEEFIPLKVFENNLRFWWLIFLLGVLGAAGGWLIHLAQPPVYEAVAVISTSIDYRQTGRLYDYEENRALGMLGQVIESKEVLDQVAAAAGSSLPGLQTRQLKQKITLERRDTAWLLRVRDADPDTAVLLADTWGNLAESALAQAHSHAVEAGALEKYLDGLTSCLEQTASLLPSPPQCGVQSLAELQGKIAAVQPKLDEELQAGKGVIPALVFSYSQPPLLPEKPVLRAQNSMALAGAVIGLLLGIAAVSFGLPQRLLRLPSHA